MADLAAHAFAREIYEQNTAIAARRVGELIAAGVSSGEFRPVHAAFVADTAAATMARIQSGAVLAATGLADADAYDELAAVLLEGIRSPHSSAACFLSALTDSKPGGQATPGLLRPGGPGLAQGTTTTTGASRLPTSRHPRAPAR